MDKKIVCLRDDDLSYFSDFSELQVGFESVLGEVPITFATVPFIHGSVPMIIERPDLYNEIIKNKMDIYDMDILKYMAFRKIYPIGENLELVNQMKKLLKHNKVEIAQHGVTHRYDGTGAEMQSKEIGKRYIIEGKEYLEKIFDTQVNVFVPPSNFIDNRCVDYIRELDMELLCCGSIRFVSRYEKIKKGLMHPWSTAKILCNRIRKECPPSKVTGGYNITNSVTLNRNDDYCTFENKVLKSLENYGAVSITSHYWYFEGENGQDYKKKYERIINLLRRQSDIEFLRASDYIERLKHYEKNIGGI